MTYHTQLYGSLLLPVICLSALEIAGLKEILLKGIFFPKQRLMATFLGSGINQNKSQAISKAELNITSGNLILDPGCHN